MNIIHLILLSQFVLMEGGNISTRPSSSSPSTAHNYSHNECTAPMCDDSSRPLDHVKIKITDKCKVLLYVDLKQTKRVLANENLPIWILSSKVDYDSLCNGNGHELQRNYEVMKKIGDFTTYQEPETSSAAIYFHKRCEFDGMISSDLLIRRLSVNKIHRTRETLLPLSRFHIYRRPQYDGHDFDSIIEDPTAGVNNQRNMKTYKNYVYEGYPEVLVIVAWDLTKYWIQRVPETNWYTSVVSNILTLFNGIDMLYSKLKRTKIQINIAGIIIETEKESLTFLNECYYPQMIENKGFIDRLDGGCVNSLLRHYLSARKEKIPIDSYDIVIYLTKEHIFQVQNKDAINAEERVFQSVHGISSFMAELYENRKHNIEIILVGSITVLEHMGSYPTIAHEMAHLMTVRHDKPPFFTNDRKCCAGLMKAEGGYCDKCLSWSEMSEETFNLFFSSPNCCAFTNKPRSLLSPGRHQMLTADQQCQCYGFESSRNYMEIPYSFCDMNLECNELNNEFHRTVIPMDGTPCGNNEVCYQTICQQIEEFETPSSLK